MRLIRSPRRLVLTLLAVLALLCAALAPLGAPLAPVPGTALAAGTTRFVDAANPAASDTLTDCTTPATPCKTIQGAINKSAAGDGIEVAPGTYSETLVITPSVAITGSVAFAGRAAGPGSALETGATTFAASREVAPHAGAPTTIVDGGGAGSVVTVPGSLVSLSGLTLRNGNAATGGGLDNEGGTVMLADSAIVSNTATSGGGGIFSSGGPLTVTASIVASNTARDGGGISSHGMLAVNASTVVSNTAARYGGGLDNDGGTAMLTDSAIVSNTAQLGGGLDNFGSVTVTTSTVASNTARNGGGVLNFGSLTMSASTVASNTAASSGGGLYNDGGMATVTTSTVASNAADGSGGGVLNFGDLNAGRMNVIASAVVSNTANFGGGLFNGDRLTVATSTVVSNTANFDGGGLRNFGAMTLLGVTVMSNTATAGGTHDGGGGISAARGTLTVSAGRIVSNTTASQGGGIWSDSGGTVTVRDSIVAANIAQSTRTGGGGIENDSGTNLVLVGSTVSENSAPAGGGLYDDGTRSTIMLTNTTVSGNSATTGSGGGIVATGPVSASAATIAANSAITAGGGISTTAGITPALKMTIVASNTAPSGPDCAGSLSSAGYTLLGNSSNCTGIISGTNGDQADVDPRLGPLADNGGPTRTHALLSGSPAIDAVPQAQCTDRSNAPLTSDQRGFPRPDAPEASCDVGALETQDFAPPTQTPTAVPTTALATATATQLSAATATSQPTATATPTSTSQAAQPTSTPTTPTQPATTATATAPASTPAAPTATQTGPHGLVQATATSTARSPATGTTTTFAATQTPRSSTPAPTASSTPHSAGGAPPTATRAPAPQAHLSLSVLPDVTTPGGLLTVGGSGFAPGEPVQVGLDGRAYTTVLASAGGLLPPTGFAVPLTIAPGRHTVFVQGTTTQRRAQAPVMVRPLHPTLQLDHSTTRIGARLCARGSGFLPGEPLTLAVDSVAVAESTASSAGRFTTCFIMPGIIVDGLNELTALGARSRSPVVVPFTGLVSPPSTFFFAGASTAIGEETELAVLNPQLHSATLTLRFFLPHGPSFVRTVIVPAHTRATLRLSRFVPGMAGFGLRLDADWVVAAQMLVRRGQKNPYTTLGSGLLSRQWYLAEGFTGLSFHETLYLLNPNTAPARMQVRLLPANGRQARLVTVVVPAQRTVRLDVNRLYPHAALAALVTSSRPTYVTRVLTFGDHQYGATANAGTPLAATSWLFAEGSAAHGRQTFLTILNPCQRAATVTALFLDPHGHVLGVRTLVVQGLHRGTLRLNDTTGAAAVASTLTSSQPVVVERPFYLGNPNAGRVGATLVYGRSGPGTRWTFPAGETTHGAQEDLLLLNPTAQPLGVRAVFYLADGRVLTRRLTVAPEARFTLRVSAVPGLAGTLHGVQLSAMSGRGFVAEQSVYNGDGTTDYGAAGLAQ